MVDEPTNGHRHLPEEIRAATSEVDVAAARAGLAELRALETDITLARLAFMRQMGMPGATFDGARDMWGVLGYASDISARQYLDRYDRGGIAGTIVDVMPDACWRGGMELIEDEDPEKSTPFEQAWDDLEERLNVTTYLMRADKLSRLSDYAIVLLGVADGNLKTELPKVRNLPNKLLYLKPYIGAGGPNLNTRQSRTQNSLDASVTIHEYELDPANERFGLPKSYRITQATEVVSNLDPVHWSRAIHVAEGCLEDDIFGRSALKRVWNLLDDLDKVTGGGAEAFWLRANQGLHMDIDKDMALPDVKDTVAALKEQAEAYKHKLTRWIRTRGVSIDTLGSDVANFASPADAVLKQISGATRVPTRILTGSEMGELASSQDRENFKDQINGRQDQHVGPNIVRQLVDRLIKYGYLPEPKAGPRKYRVKWAHIQTLTEQEKVDGAKGWASVNQTQGDTVFTDAEIREKWADKAPLTDGQRQEIADRSAEKLQQQQDIMAANQPTPAPAAEDKFPRAAEDRELIRVLEAAIVAGNTEVIHRILGLDA